MNHPQFSNNLGLNARWSGQDTAKVLKMCKILYDQESPNTLHGNCLFMTFCSKSFKWKGSSQMNGVVILPSRRDRPYFLRREVRTFRTFAASEWVCRTEYQLHQLIPQSPRQSPKTCAAACSEVTLDVARIFPLHRGWAHNGAPGHNGWETAVCFGVCCSHWNEGGIFVWKDLTWACLLHVTNKKKNPAWKCK